MPVSLRRRTINKPIVAPAAGTSGGEAHGTSGNTKMLVDRQVGGSTGRFVHALWVNVDTGTLVSGQPITSLRIKAAGVTVWDGIALAPHGVVFGSLTGSVRVDQHYGASKSWTIHGVTAGNVESAALCACSTNFASTNSDNLTFGADIAAAKTVTLSGQTAGATPANITDGNPATTVSFSLTTGSTSSYFLKSGTITIDLGTAQQVDAFRIFRNSASLTYATHAILSYASAAGGPYTTLPCAMTPGFNSASTDFTDLAVVPPSKRVSARYWRITLQGSVRGGGGALYLINGVELYQQTGGTAPENLALLGTAFCGGFTAGSPPANANAGDWTVSSFVASQPTANTLIDGACWGVDFGENSANWQDIRACRLVAQWTGQTSTYIPYPRLLLQRSNDCQRWDTMGELPAPTSAINSGAVKFINLNPALGGCLPDGKYRYWRIVPVSVAGEAFRLHEVEMFGSWFQHNKGFDGV